jgi:hypothetical protein
MLRLAKIRRKEFLRITGGAKGRGSAYPTQIDPSCSGLEIGKLANSMMGLRKIGRGERI